MTLVSDAAHRGECLPVSRQRVFRYCGWELRESRNRGPLPMKAPGAVKGPVWGRVQLYSLYRDGIPYHERSSFSLHLYRCASVYSPRAMQDCLFS
jgi:hypothetical protein